MHGKGTENKDSALNVLMTEMGKHIPETFEYNLCYWIAGGLADYSRLPYLEKARTLGPDRPEIVCDMINIGELKNDLSSAIPTVPNGIIQVSFLPVTCTITTI